MKVLGWLQILLGLFDLLLAAAVLHDQPRPLFR